MDSERGPGDVSRQSRAVLSIDPRKVDETRGRWQWPRCVFGASWPTAFTGSSNHLSSALSRMYLDSSGGWGVSPPFIFKSILNYEEEDSLPCPFSR